MKIHLDELELMQAAPASAELDPRVKLHLAACDECRAALNQVSTLRIRMNDAMALAADQPDEFWHRQQAAVRTRIAAAQREPVRASRGMLAALGAAGLATALLAGTVVWNVNHRSNDPLAVAAHAAHAAQTPQGNATPGTVNQTRAGSVLYNSGTNAADSDQEMLVAIEQELDGGAPDALSPAMGLVSEVRKAQAATSVRLKKSSKQ